jgi:DNA-binding beta-propeller fold protein YncE
VRKPLKSLRLRELLASHPWLLAVLWIALFGGVSLVQDRASRPLRVVATVELITPGDRLAFDPFGARLLIPDSAGGLTVVDPGAGQIQRYPDLFSPSEAHPTPAVVASRRYIFASNFAGNSVIVFDRRTLARVREIGVGRAPSGLAVDALHERLYVANVGFQSSRSVDRILGSLWVVDTESLLAQPLLSVEGHPFALAVAADGASLAVLELDPDAGPFLLLMDTRTRQTNRIAPGVIAAAFSDDGTLFLVGPSGSVSTTRGELIAGKALTPSVEGALALATTENDGEILVTSVVSGNGWLLRFSVRDAGVLADTGRTRVGHMPLAVLAHGSRAFVLDSGEARLYIVQTN